MRSIAEGRAKTDFTVRTANSIRAIPFLFRLTTFGLGVRHTGRPAGPEPQPAWPGLLEALIGAVYASDVCQFRDRALRVY
jgi:hypothetical protein